MSELVVYHVVTERPMKVGQHIVFDDRHHSGVYNRVMSKSSAVNDIYINPEKYNAENLEHHTRVALRELAMEEVRRCEYPKYPSRMSSLYVSGSMDEARKWAEMFVGWGRPTYQIVKLKINGNIFTGDANNCFDATTDRDKNRDLARYYWENKPNQRGESPIWETLVDGDIEVLEILDVIEKNI